MTEEATPGQRDDGQLAMKLGAIIQGVLYAVLLALALTELALMQSGASIFRYQGF